MTDAVSTIDMHFEMKSKFDHDWSNSPKVTVDLRKRKEMIDLVDNIDYYYSMY